MIIGADPKNGFAPPIRACAATVLAAFLWVSAAIVVPAHPSETAGFDRGERYYEEGYFEDRLVFEPMKKAVARAYLSQEEADIISQTVKAHLQNAFWFDSASYLPPPSFAAVDLDGDREKEILIFPGPWRYMGVVCRPICPIPVVILTRDKVEKTGFRFVGVIPAASLKEFDKEYRVIAFLYVGTHNGAGWRSLSDGPLRPSGRTVGGEPVPMGGNRFCYTAAEPPPSDFRFYGEPFTFAEMRMGFPYQAGHPGYFLTVPYHQLCP